MDLPLRIPASRLEQAGFAVIEQLPSSVESEARLEVCRAMTLTRLLKKDTLFEPGDKVDCMWAVIAGAVDLTDHDASGEKFLVSSRAAKQSIGEQTIVSDERTRSLTATVTEE